MSTAIYVMYAIVGHFQAGQGLLSMGEDEKRRRGWGTHQENHLVFIFVEMETRRERNTGNELLADGLLGHF